MDQTGRSQNSKSFKALSTAQPIRKDIEHTLNKLQLQKRKYLANDREQNLLREQYEKKRKELNALKAKVPQTVKNQKRSSQTNLNLLSVDRTYELTLNNIKRLSDNIDMKRKQILKYKDAKAKLAMEYEQMQKDIEKLNAQILAKDEHNEMLKYEIANYRDINMKNLDEFKKSHMTLNKSSLRDENDRRKYAVSTRTFLGQEDRQQKMVHHEFVSDVLKNSGLMTNEGKVDIMTDSVPLAKTRVKMMVHKNKEKIKIAEEYQKFGEGLKNLFEVMKQYKGRDDVDYLAEEFVAKEKQIQKLGQYIGKLEYQIVSQNNEMGYKIIKDQQMEKEVDGASDKEMENQYSELSKHVREDIASLKGQHSEMTGWLHKIGDILCPLVQDDDFSRNNAANVIGKIEELLAIDRTDGKQRRSEGSPIKQIAVPHIESEEHSQKIHQLLNYDKMKEYAEDYIKVKKGA